MQYTPREVYFKRKKFVVIVMMPETMMTMEFARSLFVIEKIVKTELMQAPEMRLMMESKDKI